MWPDMNVDMSGFLSGSASGEVGCALLAWAELLFAWDDLLLIWVEFVLVREALDVFYRKKKLKSQYVYRIIYLYYMVFG